MQVALFLAPVVLFSSQVQLTGPSRGLHLSAADAAACAAAAGQWSTALQTLLAEYKRSIYFPECVQICCLKSRVTTT